MVQCKVIKNYVAPPPAPTPPVYTARVRYSILLRSGLRILQFPNGSDSDTVPPGDQQRSRPEHPQRCAAHTPTRSAPYTDVEWQLRLLEEQEEVMLEEREDVREVDLEG
eukprot:COSAG06_NODE_2986_length_5985_cov_9.841828_2_plen_109_part_00